MLRSDILSAFKLGVVTFSVNGITLFLKPWNSTQRLSFASWRKENPGFSKGLFEKLFAGSVSDESGNLLFSSDDEEVQELSGEYLEKIAIRVLELNGMGDSDPKALSTTGQN